MCCMTKRFPSCPSFNSLSLCKPSEGGDKWGIVEINTGPVLQGATDKKNKKKKNSIEMVGAQTDWTGFLLLRRFLSWDVCFILPKRLGPFKKIVAHVFQRFLWKLS